MCQDSLGVLVSNLVFLCFLFLKIVQRVGISIDSSHGYRRIDGRASQSFLFSTMCGILAAVIVACVAVFGGYLGQMYACLDEGEEVSSDS